ncbi:GAF domain-containing protein [Falsiroseomonas tokyonensis]|uniref:GAF domain-containing protein n=1 Tax=Falsiroseomonas tokyonensis TaxID=430521 RepID=A0ABV7BM75_9PROT|nr:GAF domain-containing protein [Falsiroseomonas tokyonensis]MBU8536655.1 GAF domain-containing protein [Falsiroseomonas tokyonensis]
MPDAVLTAAQLSRMAEAAREARPLALLRAADEIGRQAMGHRLCTAMRFDAAAMTVRRLYSSDPESYPVGGTKPKRDTAWGRHVLLERRVFVGEGADAITEFFDDHALILGLGLRSIVNVPILHGGVCLGTVNFLWAEERVRPEWRALAELLGLVVAPDWIAA